MKLLSLFSGIGAFEKALERLKINYELVNYCEIDKYASKAYSLIHNVPESKNLNDVTKIDTAVLPKDIDLITYGFPCQDISLAGKQQGFVRADGTRTRSGLFFEALRIIEDTKPKYAIAENVKNLVSDKFTEEFRTVLSSLTNAGYNNYYQVMNAKDYGIPQNRERVFIVSIRKDIDCNEMGLGGLFGDCFEFPQPIKLKLKLKDLLEQNVDEKYYLSNEQIESFQNSTFTQNQRRLQQNDFCDTLCARDWKDPKCVQVGNMVGGKWDNLIESSRRVYSPDGLSPTVVTCGGGNQEIKIIEVGNYSPSNHDASRIVHSEGLAPTVKENHGTVTAVAYEKMQIVAEQRTDEGLRTFSDGCCGSLRTNDACGDKRVITIPEATKKGYAEAHEGDGVYLDRPEQKRGVVQKGKIQTIKCNGDDVGVVVKKQNHLEVRKLTPKECWRLMGFDDADIDICIKNEISNSQLYKMAGNSIVVNVLEYLLRELLLGDKGYGR